MKKILLIALVAFFGLSTTNVFAQCEATAAVPTPPTATIDCSAYSETDMIYTAFAVPSSGTTDQAYAVTYLHPDSMWTAWTAPIIGVTEDGAFNFEDRAPGQYCFTSFAYNQAELNIITNNATVQGLAPCLEGDESLIEIINCVDATFGLATIDAAIDSVLGTLIPALVPEFIAPNEPPCFDIIPDGMELCIDVTTNDAVCNAITSGVNDYFNDQFEVFNAPNPFQGTTTINYFSDKPTNLNFNVYNIIGALVHSSSINANTGSNSFVFDGSDLHDGVYIYTIGNDEKATPKRMIVGK